MVTDLGKIGENPRGAWSSGTADYEFLDVVTNGGASYRCVLRSGKVPAGTALGNTTYWEVSAEKGGKGDKGDQGYDGWEPIYVNVVDGNRVVQKLLDYVGGGGVKPTANVGLYIAPTGYSATISEATDIRGGTGLTGNRGWSPVFAAITDSGRVVRQLVDYINGEGTKPTAGINQYEGASGLVPLIANAVDYRGLQGNPGTANLTTWTAITFSSGSTVSYAGRIWKSNAATLSTDIPGATGGAVWVDQGSAYAVKTEIAPLLLDQVSVSTDIDFTTDIVTDFAIGATGNVFGAGGFVTTNLRDCIPGNVLKYKGNTTSGSGVRAVAGYDAAGVFISLLLPVSSDLTVKNIVVPTGVYKFRMCSGYPMAYAFSMLKYMLNRGNLNIPEIPVIMATYPALHIDRIGTLTEFDYTLDIIASTYLLANGTMISGNADYVTTNLRACAPGDIIKYKGQTVGSAVRAIAGYDASGNFVSLLLGVSSDLTVKSVTVPIGVYQYRECANILTAYSFSKMEYIIARKYLSIPDIATINSSIDVLANTVNDYYTATSVSNIPFNWKTGGFGHSIYGNWGFNPVPFPSDQFIDQIEFYTDTPLTDAMTQVKLIKITGGLITGTVTEIKTITLSIASTTRVGNIVTHFLSKPFYVIKGQFVAVKAANLALAQLADATGITNGWYYDGTVWANSPSNHGWFVNFYGKIITGTKERLMNLVYDLGDTSKVGEAVLKVRNKPAVFWRFNFSQSASDWTLNAWTVSGGIATVTTLNSMLQLKRRYVSDRRIFRVTVFFKADTVISLGSVKNLGDTAVETNFIVDIPNALLKINQQVTGNLIISTPITIPLVIDTEYLIEIERDRHISRIRIFDPKSSGTKNEVSYDYGGGSNFGSGAGNHSSNYYIKLNAGTSLSVKSIGIYGQETDNVLAGDSITDVNGRCEENWAEMTGKTLGGNYGIVAKTEAQVFHLVESLTNEIIFMKPKILCIMIGTNGAPTAAEYQPIIDFCTANKIYLVLNHVVCSGSGSHISKNIIIDSLNQMGAKFDVATAKNGDPAQGADTSKFNEGAGIEGHPNQAGNNSMTSRLLADVPILRNFS